MDLAETEHNNGSDFTSAINVRVDYAGIGVKVRNMKMDFNTGGTWRRVRQ